MGSKKVVIPPAKLEANFSILLMNLGLKMAFRRDGESPAKRRKPAVHPFGCFL
jgi:hypothetical protein